MSATVVRWNVDKPHRCPECHAVAVGEGVPSPWVVYTCCRCGTRFADHPRFARLLPEAGVCCGQHASVRDGVLDEMRQRIGELPMVDRKTVAAALASAAGGRTLTPEESR